MSINDTALKVSFVEAEFRVHDLDNVAWMQLDPVVIDHYWSGETAPADRHCSARLLWSSEALYVRFEALQNEPLIISDNPVIAQKTIGLWDRDVCEIFIAPHSETPNRYFEFEVAPTGEWIDLAIEFQSGSRVADLEYSSGMEAAARIENDSLISAIRIPWRAFGITPKRGDQWRGNLFRCVGQEPTRGYLAWQATLTGAPNFHVPEKFGTLVFVD